MINSVIKFIKNKYFIYYLRCFSRFLTVQYQYFFCFQFNYRKIQLLGQGSPPLIMEIFTSCDNSNKNYNVKNLCKFN